MPLVESSDSDEEIKKELRRKSEEDLIDLDSMVQTNKYKEDKIDFDEGEEKPDFSSSDDDDKKVLSASRKKRIRKLSYKTIY